MKNLEKLVDDLDAFIVHLHSYCLCFLVFNWDRLCLSGFNLDLVCLIVGLLNIIRLILVLSNILYSFFTHFIRLIDFFLLVNWFRGLCKHIQVTSKGCLSFSWFRSWFGPYLGKAKGQVSKSFLITQSSSRVILVLGSSLIGFIHRIIINVGFIDLNRSLSAADYLLHFSSLEFLLKLLWFTFVVFKTKRVNKAHELFIKLIAGNFVGERRITGVLVHLQKINNVVFTGKS